MRVVATATWLSNPWSFGHSTNFLAIRRKDRYYAQFTQDYICFMKPPETVREIAGSQVAEKFGYAVVLSKEEYEDYKNDEGLYWDTMQDMTIGFFKKYFITYKSRKFPLSRKLADRIIVNSYHAYYNKNLKSGKAPHSITDYNDILPQSPGPMYGPLPRWVSANCPEFVQNVVAFFNRRDPPYPRQDGKIWYLDFDLGVRIYKSAYSTAVVKSCSASVHILEGYDLNIPLAHYSRELGYMPVINHPEFKITTHDGMLVSPREAVRVMKLAIEAAELAIKPSLITRIARVLPGIGLNSIIKRI